MIYAFTENFRRTESFTGILPHLPIELTAPWSPRMPDCKQENLCQHRTREAQCRPTKTKDQEKKVLLYFIFFSRHGGVDPASFTYVANQLDCVLQTHAASRDSGTGDEEAQRVIQVYNALCKQIRALDFPLNVNSLQGISPVFRGAEVCG